MAQAVDWRSYSRISGAHLARERDAKVRQRLAENRPDPSLVGGIRIGMEQPDGDRLDRVALEPGQEGVHGLLVEGNQDVARVIHPLGDRPAQVAGHERSGPVDGNVVLLEAVLERHLDRVPEALGHDQRRPGAGPFDQGVGGERRAVNDQADRRRLHACFGDGLTDGRDDALFRDVRGGQHLGGDDSALGELKRHVREGAADVNGDSATGCCFRH